jgi:type I restriction enzyme, S subunit
MLSKPISKIAKRVSSGLTPLRSNPDFWKNGTIPWLKTEQLGEKYIYETSEKISEQALRKTSIKVCPENTLSIAMYGEGKTRGNVSIIKAEMATNQACCNVELDPELADYEYVYYFLKTQYDQLRNLSSGVRKNLNSNDIRNFVVRLPEDVCGQKKIAAVLSALDAKIDCNNRINAELEAMAKTLYDYWFVQFDFPDANGKPYKSSGGKMAYNSTLKREIPAGWLHSTIGETFKTHLGGTPSREKEEYWAPSEVNWLSSGENPSTFVVDPDERISNLGLQNSPAKLLPRGTVILSIVRHLRASILGIEAATNQSVVGIVESGAFKHCFIYPYIVREIPRLMVLRTGAQQPHINKGVLDESLLVIPEDSILEAYTRLASPLFLRMKNCHEQNRELTQLRDWLLPMLMNGQVAVA